MGAPKYFWVAATAVLVIIALILLFGHVDWDDNDDVGAPSWAGIGANA